MPWFAKRQMVFIGFSAIGLNLRVPIFTGFGTRAKVRQADGFALH
jgi:outer membrane protein TolC